MKNSNTIIIDRIKIEPPYLVIKPNVSEEEYFKMTDEDSHCELFEGEIIMDTPASARHERVFRFLFFIINGYVELKKLGEIIGSRYPMRLEEGTLVEPEIIFIKKERLGLLEKQYLNGPADLVVEILSPATYRFDLKNKREKYREHKIKEIWFIDIIKNRIIVDYLTGNEYKTVETSSGRIESKVIEGFYIEAEWVLKEEPPNSFEILRKIIEKN